MSLQLSCVFLGGKDVVAYQQWPGHEYCTDIILYKSRSSQANIQLAISVCTSNS